MQGRQVFTRLILGALLAVPWGSNGHAAVELGVQTSTIGHAIFDPNLPGLPEFEPRSVVDFLVDQDHSSGGGGVLPTVSVNWDTNTQFALTVSAPPGKRFLVRVPAGRAVGFGGFLWWESTRGGFSPPGSVSVSFTGLEGTPPLFSESDSVLSDSHGFFGFVDLEGTTVTNDFAFTSIRLVGTIVPQVTGNGTEDYVPHLESSMQLFYQTLETNDPGRFVFIVDPASTNNVLPVVEWIRPTNGAVYSADSPILLSANATDADGEISFVEFFAGANWLGRVAGRTTNSSYFLMWSDPPVGTFQLRAEAVDNSGGRGISGSVHITVTSTNVPPTNNILPVVTLTRPTNGAFFPVRSSILLTANATDADGRVNFVDFYAGTNRLGRAAGGSTNGNYNFPWTNPPAGIFRLRAEAVDNLGGRGVSAAVQITVGAGPDGLVELGVVEVSTIGHTLFSPPSMSPTNNARTTVVDHLIDQNQSSGGGALLPNVAVNWDTNSQFKLTVAAPAGHKFLVNAPAGRGVRFGGYLWWESTRGGFSGSGTVVASYAGLEGSAPEFSASDSVLSDSHGFFGFMDLDGTSVTNAFAFSSITLTAMVAPQYTGNGTENYIPHLESAMTLYYFATEPGDPGPFVSIVPSDTLPRVKVVVVDPESGTELVIFGRAGRTHVVECSPDTVVWTAISTNVMPATVCPVCPSLSVTDVTTKSVPNRFYRVIELP